MGASASIEGLKPVDASDIRGTNDLSYARSQIVNLRANLGKYALQAGFKDEVVYDGSDLCQGVDEAADFDRCVLEIAHIRQCLKLSTQRSRRATRPALSGMGDSGKLYLDPSEEKNEVESGSDSEEEVDRK